MKKEKSSWISKEDELQFSQGIYSKDERSRLLDDDEISAWEAAFMEGWDDAVT